MFCSAVFYVPSSSHLKNQHLKNYRRRLSNFNSAMFLSPFSFFFFVFSLCPLVFSQQSSTQTSTMITLSQLLKNPILQWNITTQPNPCSWKGVKCTGSSITNLSLSGVGLSSSDFLPVVCQIGSLQALDVSNNQLSSIPDKFITSCGEVDGLKLLNFSMNRLGGSFPTFNGFVGLESLDLSFNHLDGKIGVQLDELVSLKTLKLNSNTFQGTIPTNLGKSKALEHLDLSMNKLNGSIPDQIADYENLTLIDLSVNQLSGSIPARIVQLSKLNVLILCQNNLTEEIPPNLSNIPTLSRFAAHQNSFSGQIPRELTRFLKNLDLSYNKLSGSIPPDLLSQPNLESVDLSYNLLEGPIPDKVSSSLIRLRLGSNFLSEEIPSVICATPGKLTYLELDNNTFTGTIPRQLSSCQSLTLLNLAQNNLNGSVPAALGNLGDLQVMKLQMNKLSGEIPSQFEKLSKLSTLNISWNSLTGDIPSSISNLQKLSNLGLQHNNLRGMIPSSIRNMNSLMELQLGENQLSGTIPMMPTKLQILLNLSSNHFEGPIPATLRRLPGLELLDLSNNNFSGEIPEFLTQMTSLTQLILSNNQLSGDIPKFPSYVLLHTSGNPNLRDRPTPNICPAPMKRRKLDLILKSVGVAFVIGFVLFYFIVTLYCLGSFKFKMLCKSLPIPRCFYRVNNEQLHIGRDLPSSLVVHGNFFTANAIHRSKIHLPKAMEAVVDPLNICFAKAATVFKEEVDKLNLENKELKAEKSKAESSAIAAGDMAAKLESTLERHREESAARIKKLEDELKTTQAALEYKTKEVTSIAVEVILKTHAKLMQQFLDGKSSEWKPEQDIAEWEEFQKMEAEAQQEGEDDQQQEVRHEGEAGEDAIDQGDDVLSID